MEDNCADTVYLQGDPLVKMIANGAGVEVEASLSKAELNRRIQGAEAMVDDKWEARLEVASEILVMEYENKMPVRK
jgi:hypothetical protein